MYYMSTFAKVRRLFHRDHLSISEIQRRTSLSRKTIKAWLKETSSDGYKYPKRPQVNSKLTPYIPALLLALEVDSRRPKREDHGECYEMVLILSDGDDAIEIFIPKTGVDNELLAMCAQFAVVLN